MQCMRNKDLQSIDLSGYQGAMHAIVLKHPNILSSKDLRVELAIRIYISRYHLHEQY